MLSCVRCRFCSLGVPLDALLRHEETCRWGIDLAALQPRPACRNTGVWLATTAARCDTAQPATVARGRTFGVQRPDRPPLPIKLPPVCACTGMNTVYDATREIANGQILRTLTSACACMTHARTHAPIHPPTPMHMHAHGISNSHARTHALVTTRAARTPTTSDGSAWLEWSGPLIFAGRGG